MTDVRPVRMSLSLVGKTCLILWETLYLREGSRNLLLSKRVHMGIGVVIGVGTKELAVKFRLRRMKDLGNGTFSGMNIRKGYDYEGHFIPRRKSRRKLYGVNASTSHVVACYLENERDEIFCDIIREQFWISPRDQKEIIATLPEIREDCAKFAKMHAKETK